MPATTRWRRHISSLTSSSPVRPTVRTCGRCPASRAPAGPIGHPDPQVRALAAADPTLPEPPVDDADEAVRRAAAANPVLTPEVLEALLADPRTAEGAAANPSLPVPCMHALLDRCLTGDTMPPAVGC
ncbi:hypothetical protein ACWGIU_21170 [Streptomyces sp. NPDC054840]